MPKRNVKHEALPNAGSGLLTATFDGNSIPAWGPFLYKIATILTVTALSIAALTAMVVVTTSPTFMPKLIALAGITVQILASVCGLALLKLLLEYLSRSVRIEQKMNEQVVESS